MSLDDTSYMAIKELHKTSDSGITVFKEIATKVDLNIVNGSVENINVFRGCYTGYCSNILTLDELWKRCGSLSKAIKAFKVM